MLTSAVKLKDLYNLDDHEMMKMILSSGDYFPGFYRYTLGTQKVGDESLGLSTLIWLYFEEKLKSKRHHKEYWLDLQHEVHDRDVASDSARNTRNFPEVRSLFAEKMMDWYFKSEGYDIAFLDVETKVKSIKMNKTYYFMGSLIHFTKDCFYVGYSDLTGESSMTLDVAFSDVELYLKDSFNQKQIGDLFLESEIIATLTFRNSEGHLEMNEKDIDRLFLKDPDTKVFASPIESRYLPMRYAKSIRLTNFRRGEDGSFETWKTDQNW